MTDRADSRGGERPKWQCCHIGGRVALRPEEAAAALGVSRSFFFAVVLPELRVVRRGRVRLIPVRVLQEWLEENAGMVLE